VSNSNNKRKLDDRQKDIIPEKKKKTKTKKNDDRPSRLIVSLLNTKYKLYENVGSDAGRFETLGEIVGEGNSIEGLVVSKDISIYVDESGMLKNDLAQNESLAYLAYGVKKWTGLVYGPGAIACNTKRGEARMRNWLKFLDAGVIPPNSDEEIRDLWLQEGEQTQKWLQQLARGESIKEEENDDDEEGEEETTE